MCLPCVVVEESERYSLAKNQHKILNCGQKMTFLGGPKEGKTRKAGQGAMMAVRGVVIAIINLKKVQARISTKGKGKKQKGKSKEGFYPQSGLSATEAPDEERYGHIWESDDWSSSQWLDDSCSPAAGWSCTRAHTA